MSKLLRVRMLGTGGEGDPYRAPLPNYSRLIRDDETPLGAGAPRWCIVELPDGDYDPELDQGETEATVNVPDVGPVIRQMNPRRRARLLKRIRERYRERAGEYDLDPV